MWLNCANNLVKLGVNYSEGSDDFVRNLNMLNMRVFGHWLIAKHEMVI